MRASFRFLSGSLTRLNRAFEHWGEELRGNVKYKDLKSLNKAKLPINSTIDNRTFTDSKAPSSFARYATANQVVYNETGVLGKLLQRYQKQRPTHVLLTSGWNNIPGCKRHSTYVKKMESQKDIKFVWSPIYVTNRTPT